jgi:streptomycin 6-kinase
VEHVTLPRHLADALARHETRGTAGSEHAAWLRALPARVAEAAEQWHLPLHAPFEPGGKTAWVAPVTTAHGDPRVLKVGWRHIEAKHEADGLRDWNGDGAVIVYDAADHPATNTTWLLLERCVPGTTLKSRPEEEQDEVIASTLRDLWREPSGSTPYRTLAEMCDQWADEFEEEQPHSPAELDLGIARAGIELFRELPRDAPGPPMVICTDLHGDNVLSAARRPWLVIDPKPHAGDPHYDVLQHMFNCERRMSADPRRLAHRMADLAGLDRERVALWLFARCVQESPHWPWAAAIATRLAP